jgi:hypothetical protein
MAYMAVSVVGLWFGARMNVFSLALMEIVVLAVAAVSGLHMGLAAAAMTGFLATLAACAGFISAILLSYIYHTWLEEGGSAHHPRRPVRMRASRRR